jgi:hypothetical protein
MPSIGDSIANAQHTIWEAEQEPISTPNPISVDNVDPDRAQKKKTEPEKRRESLKRALDKSRALNAEREQRGGKDDKAVKAVVSGDRDENRHLLRGVLEKHRAQSEDKVTSKEINTKESREHRQSLRQRYPGAKLGELFERFENWDAQFRRDPVAAREALMSAYLQIAPHYFEKVEEKEEESGLRGSLARASADQRDLEELQPFIDKYGRNFSAVLRHLHDIDRDMIADPTGVSARLAATFGAPVTATQQAQYERRAVQERHRQQEIQNVTRGLELVIQHNVIPGMEDPAFVERIVEVLESGELPRTKDRFADLRAAADMARARQKKPADDADQRKRLDRGSRSIHGSPSTSIAGGASSSGIRKSLTKAFSRA